MYIVHAGDSEDGALLAFAPTGQAARVLSHRDSWLADADFIHVRARRLPDDATTAHLRAAARSNEPHVIDDPPSCEACGTWGARTAEGECGRCASEREEWA